MIIIFKIITMHLCGDLNVEMEKKTRYLTNQELQNTAALSLKED
jgi:hypothetical protein